MGGGIQPLSHKNHIKNLLSSIIALYFAILFLSSVLTTKYFKILLIIFSIPVSIINTIIIWYLLYYGALIDFTSMKTITATNMAETMEFLSFVFDYKMVIAFASILIPFILIYFMKPFKIKSKLINGILILSVIVIVMLTHNQRWAIREIAPLKIYHTYVVTQEHKKEFLNVLNDADKKSISFTDISSQLTDNETKTFIFIISESQNRGHFSLYGYKNMTTPYLDSIKNDLFVFNDVYSAHVYTNDAVEKMITFADNNNGLQGYEAGDIIRFFQSAGFKTYWLSNQYFLGPHESMYSAIAYRADKAVFLNEITGFFLETKYTDNALLEPLQDVLNENVKKKFIVLHLMGSHTPFETRYPDGFGSFKYSIGGKDLLGGLSKDKETATYNNSIEYTDLLLKNIIELLKKQNNEAYLLFLSDHGVDVYDTDPDKSYPRNHTNITKSMTAIPFFIWFSEKYKNSYPEIIEKVSKSLYRPYQADRVIHTILNISLLSHEKYVDSDSIISDNFTEKKRVIGKTNLDTDLIKGR